MTVNYLTIFKSQEAWGLPKDDINEIAKLLEPISAKINKLDEIEKNVNCIKNDITDHKKAIQFDDLRQKIEIIKKGYSFLRNITYNFKTENTLVIR